MPFIGLALILSGIFLADRSWRNRSPWQSLLAYVRDQPQPGQWVTIPVGTQLTTDDAKDFIERNIIAGGPGGAIGDAASKAAKGLVNSGTTKGGLTTGGLTQGKRDIVVGYARAQIGKWYRLGSAGPDLFDCSGLTMRAYQAAGITLPHNAARQQLMGKAISLGEAQPGDLLFWGASSGHVAIFTGASKMIDAPHTGAKVSERPIYDRGRIQVRRYV